MAPKKGKSLEKLVAKLEVALAASENVTIESPKRVEDKLSGNLREHDVVITIEEGHHKVTISIECRDRTRKVGTPEVEAFSKKCEDTRIDQGMIVSTTGFTMPALTKASALGIRCLSLGDALKFDWLLTAGMKTLKTNLVHTSWTILPVEELSSERIGDFQLVTVDGVVVTNQMLSNNVLQHFHESRPHRLQPGEFDRTYDFLGEGLALKDRATGEMHAVRKLVAQAHFRISIEFSPFTLMKYEEQSTETSLGEAALARIEFGDFHGQLAVIRKPDGSTVMTFVADDDSKDAGFKTTE